MKLFYFGPVGGIQPASSTLKTETFGFSSTILHGTLQDVDSSGWCPFQIFTAHNGVTPRREGTGRAELLQFLKRLAGLRKVCG